MSHLIPKTRNVVEVTILPIYVKKDWLKETLKEIKNVINNQTFKLKESDKGDPVTQCKYVYKEKMKYDGSLDKLKLRIVVRGDFQKKVIIGDTWYPTASTRTMKYFLAYSYKHNVRVQKLDFIGEFLQTNVKHRFL